MKHMKKLLVVVAALVMAMAMTATAFAAGPYSITINKNGTDKVAHTYGAYQIFKGDLAQVDDNNVLSNVDWADGVNGAAIIDELNKIDGFKLASDASAADVAKAIGDKQYTSDSTGVKAVAEALNKGIPANANPTGTVTIAENASTGVIESLEAGYYLVKDTAAVSGEGASTKYILEVVSDVVVGEKADVPSVDKEIAETTPTKVSDYNIGDSIPYTITGTLPSTFASFETYKTYTFTDTMSAGLTPPNPASVSVTVGSDDVTSLFDVAVSGQTLTVSLKAGVDLKTATHGESAFAAGDKIVVSYNAVLNDSAVIGGDGNKNTVDLKFSNNPNSDGGGEFGTTPPDETVVFTYTIEALKVEATDKAPIDDGTYAALTKEEKANYTKVDGKWQEIKPLKGAGFTLYKADGTVVKEITAGETTTFEFKGVDVGTYFLKETTVPAGYNKVNDIEITVAATYTNDVPAKIDTLTVTPETINFTADKTTGVVSGKILNQKGSVLPSTGGMGTTILYVVGGIMVLLAVVFLITKKRVASKKNDSKMI